ncbi:MAG TPA: glycosyltransferase family 39 protein, partial [Candidatus Saccharimonadales bacterium]|nr:glycosyltransferase family 39 protein [Candidatus Saccharimonadales bacterium]
IFTDEAIYVRWTQYLLSSPKFWDFSMTDGKGPTFIWIASLFMRLVSEPLLAVRLVSVVAGAGSMVGLFFLGQEVFKNRKIGFITSFIYAIYPFALVYDRLALYESMVSMFIIWSLYFEIILVRRLKLGNALILGIIMGFGMLTKTNVNFALYLLPFSLLIFDFKSKKWKANFRKWIIYAVISAIIANLIYASLRISPYFYIIAQKDTTFVYPFREWIHHPFTFFPGNIKGLGTWVMQYMTLPVLILVGSSFIAEKKYLREKLLLLVWFVAPFTALALFGKVIYPRYTLFMSMPLLVLGSYSLYCMYIRSKKKYLKVLVVLVFLLSYVLNDFLILTDFNKSSIPQSDKNQLIASWPSGVGVKETVEFLKEKSKTGKIYVGTEGTFGLMPYSLEIYLKDNQNIRTQGFWPMHALPPKEALESAKTVPTYFVFYQPCDVCPATGIVPKSWQVKQVFQIAKVEKGSYYTLYQIMPQK